MARVRISTTVDEQLLAAARETRSGVTDSVLIDEALDERRQRDALDRIEVHDRRARHGIVAWLQQHLAWDAADRCRAGSDQRAAETWDRRVSRQHDDRAAPDLGELTPPDFSPRRKRVHDEPAAARNEARSPHSSPASSGRRSYAA